MSLKLGADCFDRASAPRLDNTRPASEQRDGGMRQAGQEQAICRNWTAAAAQLACLGAGQSASSAARSLSGKEHLDEPELRHVGDALRVQDSVQMIEFVLEDARVKAVRLTLDQAAIL
jgi:hypothetical protein